MRYHSISEKNRALLLPAVSISLRRTTSSQRSTWWAASANSSSVLSRSLDQWIESFSVCRAWGGSKNINIMPLHRTRALGLHARHLQRTETELLPKGKNYAWGEVVKPELLTHFWLLHAVITSRSGDLHSSPLSAGEAILGVLYPVLGPSMQETAGHCKRSPMEATKKTKDLSTSPCSQLGSRNSGELEF